jgi:hypothetical protein
MLAKAIIQPVRFRISSHSNCGSEPARDGGLTPDGNFADVSHPKDRSLVSLDSSYRRGAEVSRSHQTRPAGRPPRAILRCPPPREGD